MTTLHLVRKAPPPDGVVAPGDAVLYERDQVWVVDPHRNPFRALSDADVLALVFEHDRVAVW